MGERVVAVAGEALVDFVPAGAPGTTGRGLNFGWKAWEGSHVFSGTPPRAGFTFPVLEKSHADDGFCSITGGYVYRGSIAGIRGHYFYADYCRGWVRSIRLDAAGERLTAHMASDKKKEAGRLPFILARGIGKAFRDGSVELEEVAAFLDRAA